MKIRYLSFIMGLFVSSSVLKASWEGTYVRTGLGTVGYKQIRIRNDQAVKGDFIDITALIEFSIVWGQVVNNSLYLGLDAQLGNLGVFYYGAGGSSCYWSPTVQGRIGIPFRACMPYIAGGIGYVKLMHRTVQGKEPEDPNFSWSVRLGCDAKITEKAYLGIYGQLMRNFNEYDIQGYDIKGSYGFSVGGCIGISF